MGWIKGNKGESYRVFICEMRTQYSIVGGRGVRESCGLRGSHADIVLHPGSD